MNDRAKEREREEEKLIFQSNYAIYMERLSKARRVGRCPNLLKINDM